MRRFGLLVALSLLASVAPAGASPRIVPQPPPEPLGLLIAHSKTIHVLRVVSNDFLNGVALKTEIKLKGEQDEAPFPCIRPTDGCEFLFRAGELVLCFRTGETAAPHVGDRWVLAYEPIQWRGEKDWFCTPEERYGVIYDGATARLREQVAAVLKGGETILTARAPAEGTENDGRLWRIKASLTINEFALSDESPLFVGWGTGEPDEAAALEQTLRTGDARQRAAAAADLAHLGSAAQPELAALHHVLHDPDVTVALAAAVALARLDRQDKEAVDSIIHRLNDKNPETRYWAVRALGDLGPRAAAALPELLRGLRDKEPGIREAVADGIGLIAGPTPSQETMEALAAVLKDEQSSVRSAAVRSLSSFGPRTWKTAAAVREGLLTPRNSHGDDFDKQAMELLARFEPPPIDFLAEAASDQRYGNPTRIAALRQLAALRSRARSALPAIRRVLSESGKPAFGEHASIRLDAAAALLAIDPKGGPAQVAPMLLAYLKEPPSDTDAHAMMLLGECGAAARPALPDLLGSLQPDNLRMVWEVESLTPLLSDKDQELLPTLRRLATSKDAGPLVLAKVLFQTGHTEEGVAQAALALDKHGASPRIEAARWLAERGRQAAGTEPALKKALQQAHGAEKARFALTLARIRGEQASGERALSLAALEDVLAVSEGVPPAAGSLNQRFFWYSDYTAWQEDESVGAAVGVVWSRLEASGVVADVLGRALEDGSPYVRLVAALVFAQVAPAQKNLVPVLRRLLERHPRFFGYAADGLAALGPKAAPLGPLMFSLTRHADAAVARAAARVLRRIDPALAAKAWGAAGAPDAVPDDPGALWADLASRDALQADLAVWRLAGAGSRAVAVVRDRLQPPPILSNERIDRLIADLDNDDFKEREQASARLAEAAEIAAPALRRALAANPPAEQRRRLKDLLADELTLEARRRLRAVRVLEGTGAAGRDVLQTLAQGDERFLVTEAARAALRRLDSR